MWEFAEHIGPSPIAWFACVESGFQSYFGTIFKLFFTLTVSLYSLQEHFLVWRWTLHGAKNNTLFWPFAWDKFA